MSRDVAAAVDIINAAQRILRFTKGITLSELLFSEEKIWAVHGNLIILGETTRRLSEDFRRAHPQIPWSSMIALRNHLVHEYDELDWNLVWVVVQRHLPALIAMLKPLVPPNSENSTLNE